MAIHGWWMYLWPFKPMETRDFALECSESNQKRPNQSQLEKYGYHCYGHGLVPNFRGKRANMLTLHEAKLTMYE